MTNIDLFHINIDVINEMFTLYRSKEPYSYNHSNERPKI